MNNVIYKVRVVTTSTNIYSEPDEFSKINGKVYKHSYYRVYDVINGFGKLRDNKGWIKMSDVEKM